MKRLLLFCFLAVVIVSCQKEIEISRSSNDYPGLKKSLADSLPVSEYTLLDFSRISRTVHNNVTLLRVGFKGKKMSESFVLVEVNNNGTIKRGRMVSLTRDKVEETFNGTLTLKNLKGITIEKTDIIRGYRAKNSIMLRQQVVPDPYVELPEVIVVASYPSSGGISWGTWMNLMSFFDSGGGGWGGWYSGGDPYGGGGGGGGGAGGSGGGSGGGGYVPPSNNPPGPIVVDDEVMEVDFESQYGDPAIDLDKYLKCFDNIPDAGATCKITIHSDVPVDSDPTKIFDWSAGSPGHSWIRLEKRGANGSGMASQHIGFYPKTGWKTILTDAPLDGKFVDNGSHEFNASYEVSVSPENLRSAIMRIRQLRNVKYDIDDYNCTDWSIEVWRSAVSPSIWFDIPRFHMPGSLSPGGTSTPQGLYVKIKELQDAGVQGASVPVIGWSGSSTGPCN